MTLVNKDFVPRGKMFMMYIWAPNSNTFPELLYHPHLSLSDRESSDEDVG